jgi:S1-C subfamily serine protease
MLRAMLLVVLLMGSFAAQAQDGVPIEMLDRTLLIRHGDSIGTAFEIERHHKKFLVTARHVVAGLPETDATLQVMRNDKWVDYATIRTLFPKSPAVDIAVLETRDAADETFYVAPADRGVGGATFGQNVWFLGFPYGIGTHIASSTGNGVFYPFIKHGILSAIDSSDPNANIIFIDGHNNPGFSGGPVLYVDLSDHKYKILGVISSYRVEATQTAVDGKLVDSPLLANSGIIQSYSIRYALDAIDAEFH